MNASAELKASELPPARSLSRLRPALEFVAPYKAQVAIAGGALLTTAAATLAIGQGMRLLIDGTDTSASSLLTNPSLLFTVLVAVLIAGTFLRFYFVSWLGERVTADIRAAVFAHIIHLHPGFFESNAPSEIQSRITTDTTLLQTVIGSSVSIALRNILMFFGGIALMFVTNATMSVLVLSGVPLVVLPVIFFGRRVRSLSRDSQDRLADVGSYAGESLRQIKVVQAFNRQEGDISRFLLRVEEALAVAIKRIRQRSILIVVVMSLAFGAVSALVQYGGASVASVGGPTSGEMAAFIFYAVIVAGSLGAISEVWSDLQRAAGATERLAELLAAPSLIRDGTKVLDASVDSAGVDLRFNQVSFSYPTNPDKTVIKALNLHVSPGEMIAIVGPSGAGKSTLFDLVQRFYDPSNGVVVVNGQDVRELQLTSLRQAFGWVPQDAALFAGSIKENLAYSNSAISEAEIYTALEQAHALDFIETLADGLATRLGEGGVGLSGGQKQRLIIARALLAKPSCLLLDEVTSALDAESESAIRSSIQQLQGRMTILVIAHRLSTVRQADRIVVMRKGEIIAQGTHAELLETSKLYQRYSAMQFAS